MEDKEMKEFSRTAFFLVTGFSFIVFSKVHQFLNRSPLPLLLDRCYCNNDRFIILHRDIKRKVREN
jgi:hypothetical protein